MLSAIAAVFIAIFIIAIALTLTIVFANEGEKFWAAVSFVFILCAAGVISVAVWVDETIERVTESTTYVDIKEVGTAEAPKQVAVVDGKIVDVSAMTNTLLYDADIYYLRIVRKVDPRIAEKRFCFIYKESTTKYTVVPRSLVEVQ